VLSVGCCVLSSLSSLLDFAIDVAWQAGRSTLVHFQTGVAIERKADRSLVTVADRDAERLVRRLIEHRFPSHAVLGEELGGDGRDATHRWVIDPIDGTNSFVHGVPFYGTLVGLEIRGEPVLGAAYFPALNEMLAAAAGEGCRWNGRSAHVSRVADLSEACLVYTDGQQVRARIGARWDTFTAVAALTRGWGDCYGHCLVATGRAEIMIDPRMNPWDCVALVPILQEAGGRFTDWQGVMRVDGGDAVSSNGLLHDTFLRLAREDSANRG
jgi:histidinol-phosphatase